MTNLYLCVCVWISICHIEFVCIVVFVPVLCVLAVLVNTKQHLKGPVMINKYPFIHSYVKYHFKCKCSMKSALSVLIIIDKLFSYDYFDELLI